MTDYLLENNEDYVIRNVHPESACDAQEACAIHKMTSHHMRHFPQHFRGDTGVMERICNHGIGHPDPDGMHYWRARGDDWAGVHGCDGCCRVNTSLPIYHADTT